MKKYTLTLGFILAIQLILNVQYLDAKCGAGPKIVTVDCGVDFQLRSTCIS
jgi:hypothetical protein